MFIYKIENKINGKLYVGKTQKSLEERFTGHKERARAKYNCHLYNSMNHYGFVNFEIKIIEECKTEDELNEREIYWIKFLKTLDRKKGYNMTIGGTGGDTFSNQNEERRKERLEKQRVSMIGKNKDKKRTKAEKENLRVINTGKKVSIATKEKIRKAQKIAQNRPEVKKKKSEAMKGKKHTKETIEKIRVGNLGKKHKKKQHIFCIGDIHGAYRALKQVLERASFDYEKDTLISLGDTADGWTETAECFEELLKIKNLIYVKGNHDSWLQHWLENGKQPRVWTMQGGQNTILSYMKHPELKESHKQFLKKVPYYYLDKKNRLFVHGGIDFNYSLEEQDKMYMMWDRHLVNEYLYDIIPEDKYKEIYLGHTSIYGWSKVPVCHGDIWCMDTGAGWEGVLSMMDINSKKVFQSDIVAELYPEVVEMRKR